MLLQGQLLSNPQTSRQFDPSFGAVTSTVLYICYYVLSKNEVICLETSQSYLNYFNYFWVLLEEEEH